MGYKDVWKCLECGKIYDSILPPIVCPKCGTRLLTSRNGKPVAIATHCRWVIAKKQFFRWKEKEDTNEEINHLCTFMYCFALSMCLCT